MDDDLNISKALATIFYFVGEVNKLMAKHRINEKNVQSAIILMEDFDRILGILDHGKQTLDQEIETLIRRRDEARANKDWKTADEIRSQLKAKGIILEDKEGGVRWRKVKSGT
jgi:cysteinyl-tRNA synthetase